MMRKLLITLVATASISGSALAAQTEPSLTNEELQQQKTMKPYQEAAKQCSEIALRRYALSSTEPAEKVAEAAFDKCSNLWHQLTEAGDRMFMASDIGKETMKNCIKKRGLSYSECLPRPGIALDREREVFVHDSQLEAFDIRADEAGPAPPAHKLPAPDRKPTIRAMDGTEIR